MNGHLDLSRSGWSSSVYSQTDGSYAFNGLSAAAYSVSMVTPVSDPGQDAAEYRAIVDRHDNLVSTAAAGTVLQNAYNDVHLGDGCSGINFNFAELTYPIATPLQAAAAQHRPGIFHTPDVTPIPEPGRYCCWLLPAWFSAASHGVVAGSAAESLGTASSYFSQQRRPAQSQISCSLFAFVSLRELCTLAPITWSPVPYTLTLNL